MFFFQGLEQDVETAPLLPSRSLRHCRRTGSLFLFYQPVSQRVNTDAWPSPHVDPTMQALVAGDEACANCGKTGAILST